MGLDLKEKKITLPLLGALKNASEEEAKDIRRKVCRIDEHPEWQKEIVEFVHRNGGLEYARKRLYEYVERAKLSLRPLGKSEDADKLADIAEFTADRKS